MNNIFKEFNVGNRWDLKGSSQGRTYLKDGRTFEDLKTRNVQTAMKDNDYRTNIGKLKLVERLDPAQERSLQDILESDAHFLADCNIIDYSLILGEVQIKDRNLLMQTIDENPDAGTNLYVSSTGAIYQMGIIDPLTNFNGKKRMEYLLKRCKSGHRMSCVPPERYAQRFINFMHEIFVEEEMTRVESPTSTNNN